MIIRIRTTVAHFSVSSSAAWGIHPFAGLVRIGAIGLLHDIFIIVIPTSGTQDARRKVIFTLQAFLLQPVIFSEGCKPVSR
jgi:hypothetical protein